MSRNVATMRHSLNVVVASSTVMETSLFVVLGAVNPGLGRWPALKPPLRLNVSRVFPAGSGRPTTHGHARDAPTTYAPPGRMLEHQDDGSHGRPGDGRQGQAGGTGT